VDEQSFGRRLRRVRRAKDITQHQLAALSGLHMSSIAKLESGATGHALDETVAALARALGVSTDYLLGLTQESGIDSPLYGERSAGAV
jgi:transcriptional regulator with XRE-family HTH domain